MSKDKSDDEKNLNFIALFAFGGVVLLWLASWVLIDKFVPDAARGVFGDKFGSINSLFSGLAFAGLIYAILLQRIELKLQRRELELTRDELRGQRGEFEEQNKTLKRQRFENTFFQMLALHNDIINSMSSGVGDGELRGRYLLKSLSSQLIRRIGRRDGRDVSRWDFNYTNFQYDLFYEDCRSLMGIYFRNLYRLFKFVDESYLSEDDKKFYTNIVRAQLSDQELQMLFYNCINIKGGKFKVYVEKYSLLNNLTPNLIAFFDDAKHMYSIQAYGSEYPT